MSKRSQHWYSKRRSVRRPVSPHAAPGSITIDPLAPKSRLTCLAYGPDSFEEQELKHVSEVATWEGRFPVLWINVDGLGDAEAIQDLGRIFRLHPLALEDVVNTHQRAKCDDYGDFLYVVARMVDAAFEGSEQISLFIGENTLITFQEDRNGDSLEPVRQRIRFNSGRIRKLGTDYLLYELFDAIVEGYFPMVERFGERLDDLDEICDVREVGQRLSVLHQLRVDLLYLRRVIWPHRDALQTLMRGGHQQIHRETELYLRDCNDHLVQLIDILEIFRENCSDLREFLYSQVSNRTNEIMRTLTIISTLFLPMTFVAGVYGMNFDHMPELRWRWGYPLSLLLMGIIGGLFLTYFYRRGWLQAPHEPDRRNKV